MIYISIPCWRPLWTCHLWKLTLGLYLYLYYLYLYFIKRSKKQQENSLMIEIWAPVSLVLGSGTILFKFYLYLIPYIFCIVYECVSSVSGLWDQVTWPRRRPHQFIRNTLPHMQPASAVRAEHRNRVSWSHAYRGGENISTIPYMIIIVCAIQCFWVKRVFWFN